MKMLSVIATYGFFLEIALLFIIVIMTFALKTYKYYKNRRLAEIKLQIENYLNNCINDNSRVYTTLFLNHWKKLGILIHIINEFDKNQDGRNWLTIRSSLIKNVVLPLARIAASDPDWRMRHYAALVFDIHADNEDVIYISKLLDDSIPLVKYAAATSGLKFGSEKMIDKVVKLMATESWLTQSIYMQGFNDIPYATHFILERLLMNTNEPRVRATIYTILLKYPKFEINWKIENDIHSGNELLALSAIRYKAYCNTDDTESMLISLLQDTNWKIRAVVLSCLGNMKLAIIKPEITTCLKDENWLVRNAALQALIKLNKNTNNLSMFELEEATLNLDIAQSVLNTF